MKDPYSAAVGVLQGTFETALDAVLILEGDTPTYSAANAAAERLLGYDRRHLCGLGPVDLIDPDERARLVDVREALLEAKSWRGAMRLRREDGSPVFTEMTAYRYERPGAPVELHQFREAPTWSQGLSPLEARYQRIVDIAQEGIWEIDTERRTTFATRRMAEMLGTTVDELVGSSVQSYLDEWWPVVEPRLDQAGPRKTAAQHEIRLRRRDGSEFLAVVTAVAVHDMSGNQVGALLLVSDRTLWRETIKTLQRRERQLAWTQRLTHAGSWEWDVKTDTVDWTDEIYQIYGMETATRPLTYQESMRRIHPDDQSLVLHAMKLGGKVGAPHMGEYRIISRGGEIRVVQTTRDGIEEEDGRTVRMYGTVQDITERRRVEAALHISERRLAETQRLAGIGSWDWDAVTQHTNCSDEFYRIYGMDEKDGPLTFSEIQAAHHSDDREQLWNAVRASATQGADFVMDSRIVRPDGEVRLVDLRGHGVRDADGRLLRIVGTVQDITARTLAEERIQRLNGDLATALSASELRTRELNALLEDAVDIVVRYEPDLRMVYANPAAERAAGVSRDELVGRTPEASGMPADIAATYNQALRQVFTTGRDRLIDVPSWRRPGVYQARLTPVFGDDETVASVLLIARDVSEQRRAEAEHEALFRALLEREERLHATIERMIREHASVEARRQSADEILRQLTPRERDLVRHLADGLTNRQIGDALGLTTGSVKNYISRLLSKLGATTRAQAVARIAELHLAN